MSEPITLSAQAAALSAGVTAVTLQPSLVLGIAPLDVVLWGCAGAFFGLARTDPDAIRSMVQIQGETVTAKAVQAIIGLSCLLVTLACNASLGIGATVMVPHVFPSTVTWPLWPLALGVSFGMQKLAPIAVDAAGTFIPSWFRSKAPKP